MQPLPGSTVHSAAVAGCSAQLTDLYGSSSNSNNRSCLHMPQVWSKRQRSRHHDDLKHSMLPYHLGEKSTGCYCPYSLFYCRCNKSWRWPSGHDSKEHACTSEECLTEHCQHSAKVYILYPGETWRLHPLWSVHRSRQVAAEASAMKIHQTIHIKSAHLRQLLL